MGGESLVKYETEKLSMSYVPSGPQRRGKVVFDIFNPEGFASPVEVYRLGSGLIQLLEIPSNKNNLIVAPNEALDIMTNEALDIMRARVAFQCDDGNYVLRKEWHFSRC